jgi:hypothetical protein
LKLAGGLPYKPPVLSLAPRWLLGPDHQHAVILVKDDFMFFSAEEQPASLVEHLAIELLEVAHRFNPDLQSQSSFHCSFPSLRRLRVRSSPVLRRQACPQNAFQLTLPVFGRSCRGSPPSLPGSQKNPMNPKTHGVRSFSVEILLDPLPIVSQQSVPISNYIQPLDWRINGSSGAREERWKGRS